MNKMWATFFGTGYWKYGPGTFASAASLPILVGLRWSITTYYFTLLFVLLLPFGMRVCEKGEDIFGKDDKRIVLDEVIGLAVGMIFLGKILLVRVIVFFILFRVLDILKPWPISVLDKMNGGVGVAGDDIMAGALAGFIASWF